MIENIAFNIAINDRRQKSISINEIQQSLISGLSLDESKSLFKLQMKRDFIWILHKGITFIM